MYSGVCMLAQCRWEVGIGLEVEGWQGAGGWGVEVCEKGDVYSYNFYLIFALCIHL